MKVLLLNPNTTESMTEHVVQTARGYAPPEALLVPLTAKRGVSVVATQASYAIAAGSALEAWAEYEEEVDAIVLACFGDPGLGALRELASVPVFGLAESSLWEATRSYSGRFAIVTAGLSWKGMLDALVHQYGFDTRYLATYAIDSTGLELARQPARFAELLQDQIDAANRDGANVIVLGGAALAGLSGGFSSTAPLLDCVQVTMAAICEQSTSPWLRAPLARVPIESAGLPDRLATRLRASA